MTQEQAIRAEIERRKIKGKSYYPALIELLDIIYSLPEEKPSKDLDEAAKEYAYSWRKEGNKEVRELFPQVAKDAFIAGAKWQTEQMEKAWLADRESQFWDGVEEGKKSLLRDMVGVKLDGDKRRDLRLVDESSKCICKVNAKGGDWVHILVTKDD